MKESSDWRNPIHYQKSGFEAIDIIQSVLTPEQFSGYIIGNELKYLLRVNDKDTPQMNHGKVNWYNIHLENLIESCPEIKATMQNNGKQ
jgi:hypothetical protein